jgi:predicted DNA-binding WGR domain protein
MTTRQLYFKNTSGSHNKDYTITWNQTTNDVDISYGKIGGTKNTMVEHFFSADTAGSFVMEKFERRLAHGYGLVSDTTSGDPAPVSLPPVQTMGSHEFDADLADLQHAERLVPRAS